ncbi:unnamed protein product [Calypogeia fissa]
MAVRGGTVSRGGERRTKRKGRTAIRIMGKSGSDEEGKSATGSVAAACLLESSSYLIVLVLLQAHTGSQLDLERELELGFSSTELWVGGDQSAM